MRILSTQRVLADTPFALAPLEPRLALSAVVDPQGTLVIICDALASSVEINPGSSNGSVVVTGLPGNIAPTTFTAVRRITIDLRSGDDFLEIGTPLDPDGDPMPITALAGNGNDFIFGGNGRSDFRGGAGRDRIESGSADDLIKGGKGDDILMGHAGNDRLDGQKGTDRLYGGDGDDLCFGGDQPDLVYGNKGNDTVRGGKGADFYLIGGPGNDAIFGDGGSDNPTGTASEFKDFGPTDRHWSAFFGHDLTHAFLPNAYWTELSAAEMGATTSPTLYDETDVLIEANSRTAPKQVEFAVALAALSPTQRNQYRQTLISMTDAYIDPLIANPDSYTSSGLATFFVNLELATPTPLRTILHAFHTTFRATLDELDFTEKTPLSSLSQEGSVLCTALYKAFGTILNHSIEFE